MLKKVHEYHMGNAVRCDLCNEDYTESKKSGGFIVSGKAVCPNCSKHILKIIKDCKETHLIEVKCKKDQSFGDLVRDYRGDNDKVTCYSFNDVTDLLGV